MNRMTTETTMIRQATERDAHAVAEIYNHYVGAGGATFETEHWSESQAAKYLKTVPPDIWLVAETDAAVTGWSSVRRYSLRDGYRHTCESAIYLASAAWGTGVGDALQQRMDAHCRSHRMHHLVARVIAENRHSMAFHRRHGFELVGVQREIGNIGGRWIDVAIMQKIYQ